MKTIRIKIGPVCIRLQMGIRRGVALGNGMPVTGGQASTSSRQAKCRGNGIPLLAIGPGGIDGVCSEQYVGVGRRGRIFSVERR